MVAIKSTTDPVYKHFLLRFGKSLADETKGLYYLRPLYPAPLRGARYKKKKKTARREAIRGADMPPELLKSVYAQKRCTINGFSEKKRFGKPQIDS